MSKAVKKAQRKVLHKKEALQKALKNHKPGNIGRRGFLKGSLATGAALAATSLLKKKAQAADDDMGVASGDPTGTSVVLWTRVPSSFQSGADQDVNWQVATNEAFDAADIVASGSFTTSPEQDYTVKFKVGGLQSFTRYHYRFTTASGYVSEVGRTMTAPAEGATVEKLRFSFISCSKLSSDHWNVVDALAQEELHFCIHLGDNIYEHSLGYKATTLTDFRDLYKKYLSEQPALREARRLFPWVYVWDDHETFNNYAGGSEDFSSANRELQANAYQAFSEYMTVDTDIEVVTEDGIPEYRLYRQLKFGSLLDVFAIDGRQYRDGPICGRDILVSACDDLYDPERTNLGEAQTQWLKDGYRDSLATWKVTLNQTMMMALKITNSLKPVFERLEPVSLAETSEGMVINLDQWDGYPANRADILSSVEDAGVDNLIVLTGDIHNCYAGELKSDFTSRRDKSCGVEFVVGSVTSDGIAESIGGFDISDLASAALKPANPHLLWLDAYYHAYAVMELTLTQCLVTYVGVDTISSPEYSTVEMQRFTVLAGENRLIVEE